MWPLSARCEHCVTGCTVSFTHTHTHTQIDMATGDKYYQQVKFDNGKMVPGSWASNGMKQRTHMVTERDGGLFLEISTHPPL